MGDAEQTAVELLQQRAALLRPRGGGARALLPGSRFPAPSRPATRVFHEGDTPTPATSSRAGSFRVTREHSDGRAITLATLGPGDIFGELAMLDGEVARPASKRSLDGELLALPAGDVRALLSRHPEIALKLVAGAGAPPAHRQRADLAPVLPDRPQPRRRGPLPARREESPQAGERRRGDDPDEPDRPGPARRHLARERQPLPRRPRARRVVRSGRGRVTVLDPPKLRNYIY